MRIKIFGFELIIRRVNRGINKCDLISKEALMAPMILAKSLRKVKDSLDDLKKHELYRLIK